jgi:hypothetical protein
MKAVHYMPGLIIALSFAAAIVYAWHHDWRRATYWLAACVLNVSVTI